MNQNQPNSLLDVSETDRLAYFDAIYQSFETAAQQAGGATEHFYGIGGYTVCLKFAGSGLIPHVTPALSHLVALPTATPDLTVCLFDSVSTDQKLPLPIAILTHLLRTSWFDFLDPRREVKGFNSDRFRMSFHVGPNILSGLDTQRNLAVYWLEDAEKVPYWERGSPLQTILNWWMGRHQRQYIHAGAVGNASGGVLLAGKGGSGKSSTALACLQSDLTYASDDYCLIATDPEPYVYSLYNTAKLKGAVDLAERFPHLTPLLSNGDRLNEEKAMVFLQKHYPEKLSLGFPIRAILLPCVTGKPETAVRSINAIQALKALAPSTLFQTTGTGQEAFQMMSTLVRKIPCYQLELGTNIAQIPEVISSLLTSSQTTNF